MKVSLAMMKAPSTRDDARICKCSILPPRRCRKRRHTAGPFCNLMRKSAVGLLDVVLGDRTEMGSRNATVGLSA